MKHKKSKFVWDAMTMTLVKGRGPTKDGQLVKGESTTGDKMELVGDEDCGHVYLVCYWGWSS